jgi:hypothetical protein
MIHVILKGGMGNQLFQYALGRALQFRGQQVRYDISSFAPGGERRFMLPDLGLNVKIGEAHGNRVFVEKSLRFNPLVLDLKEDWILDGYWQCEKYFEDVAGVIRKEVLSPYFPSNEVNNISIQIATSRSCFIHLRRGDNIREDHKNGPYWGLSEIDCPYYVQAIHKVIKAIPAVHFFIFTDDPNYFSEINSIDAEFTLVPALSEAEHLWLMSLCWHAIIANSTFSWWGAFLNQHEGNSERIVTAPDPWYATDEFGPTDIIPARWTKVSR